MYMHNINVLSECSCIIIMMSAIYTTSYAKISYTTYSRTSIIQHSMGLKIDVGLQRLSDYRSCQITEVVRLSSASKYSQTW